MYERTGSSVRWLCAAAVVLSTIMLGGGGAPPEPLTETQIAEMTMVEVNALLPELAKARARAQRTGDNELAVRLKREFDLLLARKGPGTSADRRSPRDEKKIDGRVADFEVVEWRLMDLLPIIARETGKTVIPIRLLTLQTKKITLVGAGDDDLPQITAAMFLAGVGLIERENAIVVGIVDELAFVGTPPILDVDDPVAARTAYGFVIVKVYAVERDAKEMAKHIAPLLPGHASLIVDQESGRLVLRAEVGFCRLVQKVIDSLDSED